MKQLGVVIASASLAACAARHPLRVDCDRHLVPINAPAASITGEARAADGISSREAAHTLASGSNRRRVGSPAQRAGRVAPRHRSP